MWCTQTGDVVFRSVPQAQGRGRGVTEIMLRRMQLCRQSLAGRSVITQCQVKCMCPLAC